MNESTINENIMRFYNTDVVGSYKFKLSGLDYVSIAKLFLTQSEQKQLIELARKGHNNLALSDAEPMAICVKKSFYNEYIVKNAADQNYLNIKIKSDDPDFISNLMKFLAKNKNVDFAIILSSESKEDDLFREQLDFLCSNIVNAGFKTRTTNCLVPLNIQYVFRIAEYGNQLFKVKDFGEVSMEDVKFVFGKKGLNFFKIPKDIIAAAQSRCETKLIV